MSYALVRWFQSIGLLFSLSLSRPYMEAVPTRGRNLIVATFVLFNTGRV
uniref:Uncharacterized protein n=1 Tax=Rhizophora mucronata TaxID=61149 RepID=A0A2P2J5K7_RHIMU